VGRVSVLTFIVDATNEQVQAVADALATLRARLPGLKAYSFGPDLGLNDGNASFVVVADFETVDDYYAYRDDPEHQRILSELIRPILAGRAAVQYDVAES
jgi:hypothetical protein